ncbi:MAG: hypothetical protein LUE14_09975 [Clostridiales bacterium]|nr:hypothetical protein [Clostridiales bacterium]
MANDYYAFYDSDGLGVYRDHNRFMRVVSRCFDCPVVKRFDSITAAISFAVGGYNGLLEAEGAESGFFPEGSYVSVNYVYFRREL